MRNYINYFLYLILLLCISVVLSYSQEEQWFEKGMKYLLDKKIDLAIEEFSKVIDINPKNKEAFYNRGLANLYQSKLVESINDFSAAIGIDSNFIDALNYRGLAYSFKNELNDAYGDYYRVLLLDSTRADAWFNRGLISFNWTDYPSALRDFSKAVEFSPTNPEYYLNKGKVNNKLNKIDSSISDYSMSIKSGKKTSEIFYLRGNVYFRKEQYDKAIADYSQSIKLDSKNIDALNNRAVAYEKKGEVKLAEKDRSRIKELNKKLNKLPVVDSIKFVTYSNKIGNIKIDLPQGWTKLESSGKYFNNMTVTLDKITSDTSGFSVGVQLSMNTDLNEQYKVSEPSNLLEFWRGSVMQNSKEYNKYNIMSTKSFKKGEWMGLLNKVQLQMTSNSQIVRMYELVLAKTDTLFYAYFQSNEALFGYYKDIFDKAVESIKLE